MICVERYADDRRAEWNAFLAEARNATFLFHRNYMEYHADRFQDHSLLIRDEGRLLALLPANLRLDGCLVSHEGLTYGGFVFPPDIKLRGALATIRAALQHLDAEGIRLLRYKALPAFYAAVPDDDVSYALFLLNARLYRRDTAVAVDASEARALSKGRKSEISKARRHGVTAAETCDYGPFWSEVLIPNLRQRYGVSPVHTVEEISRLAAAFPRNIRQFCAYLNGALTAGITVYETERVAHAQYIGVTDAGRDAGALDFLVAHLLTAVYTDKRFFDLGICNEQGSLRLNTGLLAWKEGFGGRCFRHDFYEIDPGNFGRLDAVIGPSA